MICTVGTGVGSRAMLATGGEILVNTSYYASYDAAFETGKIRRAIGTEEGVSVFGIGCFPPLNFAKSS